MNPCFVDNFLDDWIYTFKLAILTTRYSDAYHAYFVRNLEWSNGNK